MESSARATNFRPNRFNGYFAVVAIGVHAALLMIPLGITFKAPQLDRTTLEISLLTPRLKAESKPEKPEPSGPEPGPTRADPVQPLPNAPANANVAEPKDDLSRSARRTGAVTSAFLLEQVHTLVPFDDADTSRKLGTMRLQALPGNWTRPLLPHFSSPFEDDFAPVENEVLDQWVEPDGTRRVVMRTPTGHTLCGSLEQRDPFNPLFEPVAMYHQCAGGGRRKQR